MYNYPDFSRKPERKNSSCSFQRVSIILKTDADPSELLDAMILLAEQFEDHTDEPVSFDDDTACVEDVDASATK